MSDEEQAKISSEAYWHMTEQQVQSVNGKNLTAAILNELALDSVDRRKIHKFSKYQIAAMPNTEKKELIPAVYENLTDNQRRALVGYIGTGKGEAVRLENK